MKNHPSSSVCVASMMLGVALSGVACSKHDRAELKADTQQAYADTKAAFASGWEKVKSFSFEKRDQFAASAKSLGSRMDAEASKLRANFSEATASAKRKAAMDELKNAQADYKQKLNALGEATSATWDAGKANVIAAWDRLEAAYRKARED